MGIEPPFIYDQPSRYSLVEQKPFNPTAPRFSKSPKPAKPRQNGPYISPQEFNKHPDSYMIIPYGNLNWKPLAKNTKAVVKWSRVCLLLLRICAWIGAAGLLVCVVCIKPIGSTMDWVMRIPPGAALMHLTYAIYHLSRSARSRTPASSASYMIFGAILDSCLIPFQVLLAILARNQLLDALEDGTQRWETILHNDFQRHAIILSTYLLGITTASLHFVAFCLSIFLTMKFKQIAQLPPDMNPLEDNLTARGHKKAKTSVSTFMSETDDAVSTAPPMSNPSRTIPWAHTRTDSGSTVPGPKRRDEVHSLVSQKSLDQSHYPPAPKQKHRFQHNPQAFHGAGPTYSILSEDTENWITHNPTPPDSPPSSGPTELQYLRSYPSEDERLRPAPLSARSKYDFSNRSPKPLGLHPPTPRVTTPAAASGKGFDIRTLRNIDGNSSAKRRTSKTVWDGIELEIDSMDPASAPTSTKKQYGDVVSLGQMARTQARVVSSGVDKNVSEQGIRMRDVSGKIAEEGRGGLRCTEF